MAEIPYDEETTRDWSWYAVDDAGHVAEFSTGGFRFLPASVRSDWECAEELIAYFDGAPVTTGAVIRPEFLVSEIILGDPAILKDQKRREWYFRSFTAAASRGLFAYDTLLKQEGDYFGVTIPERPLHVSMLPEEVQKQLLCTRATFSFRETPRISEAVTLTW